MTLVITDLSGARLSIAVADIFSMRLEAPADAQAPEVVEGQLVEPCGHAPGGSHGVTCTKPEGHPGDHGDRHESWPAVRCAGCGCDLDVTDVDDVPADILCYRCETQRDAARCDDAWERGW